MKPILVFLLLITLKFYSQDTVSFPENGTSLTADLSEIAWKEITGGDHKTNIYILIEHDDGSTEEVKFNYTKQ